MGLILEQAEYWYPTVISESWNQYRIATHNFGNKNLGLRKHRTSRASLYTFSTFSQMALIAILTFPGDEIKRQKPGRIVIDERDRRLEVELVWFDSQPNPLPSLLLALLSTRRDTE